MTQQIDAIDRRLVNRLQEPLPIVSHPFADVANEIGMSEADLLERLVRLRGDGIFTRFGPFIDAEAMGGAFCLCAIAVPPERFEEVAAIVNDHAEVAHNYERTHRLNMWFVLATESPEGIDRAADAIEAETGLKVLRFPKLREFYIGFRVSA